MQIKGKLSIKRRRDQKYLIFCLQKRAHTVGREEERKEEEKRRRRGEEKRKRREEEEQKMYRILKFCMDFHDIVWISMELYG